MPDMKPPVAFERWIAKWVALPAATLVIVAAILFDLRQCQDCRRSCLDLQHDDYHFVAGSRVGPSRCTCLPLDGMPPASR